MISINIIRSIKCKYIIAGVIAGIIIGILEVSRPEAAIGLGIAIICTVFLMLLKIKYDLFVFLDILLLSVVLFEPSPSDLLFGILIVFGIISQTLNLKKIRIHSFPILIYLAYFFVCILSIINAVDIFQAIKFFTITFYLFLFSVFIFSYTTPEKLPAILRAYILSTLLASILGFMGYMGFFPHYLMAYSSRAKALFKDPNVFGPFLIPTVIILLDDLRSKRILKTNAFVHAGIIAVTTLAVVLSFSRAAWINLCIAVLVYLLLNFRKIGLFKISVFIMSFVVLAAALWFFAGNNSLKTFIDSRAKMQDYDKNRFASQRAGLQLAYQNPLGYGPGQYELVVSQITSEQISAHSLYFRLFTENGAAGLILFFTALIFIIINLFKIQGKESESVPIKSSVLLSILIGILVNSLVVDTLHWRHFWLFIGLALFNIAEYNKFSSNCPNTLIRDHLNRRYTKSEFK